MAVDTRTAPRRTLHFDSIADMRADLDRIERAHAAGTLRATGNWSPGQVLGHLATWIGFAYDGPPPESIPALPVRLLLRLTKRRWLGRTLPAGFRIPRVEGGTFGIEPLAFDEGMRGLRAGLKRLESEPPPPHHPLFGRMTHEDWIQLHLRHAELHLGFLDPGA